MQNKSLYNIWIGSLAILIILGMITVVRVFIEGHGALFHSDDRIPWTLLLAAYIFFVLTSSGITFISSIPLVFGYKSFMPIAKRSSYIAFAALIAGFISIGMELGKPLNMIYYFISPNLTSAIWWMGFLYSFYLVFLIIKIWRMHKNDWASKLSKIASYGSFLTAIAALSTLGSVFGVSEARPTYFGEFIPVYFLLTALLSGLSAIMIIIPLYHKFSKGYVPETEVLIFDKLSKIFIAIIGASILLSIWRAVVGLYANRPEYQIVSQMINSYPYRVEVLIGLIIPFTMMLISKIRKSNNGKLIAGILVLIGLGVGRMDMIMIGQIHPIMPKTNMNQEVLMYFPSIWEWVISAFALAVMFLLYTMSEKYMKLSETPSEHINNK